VCSLVHYANFAHKELVPYTLKMLGLYFLGQNCLHLTFEQYLSSETYSRKYEKLPNIVILACKNNTEKMHLLKMSGPQKNLDWFIYISTHCVETVKWLDHNRYYQLTRWWGGNASALGARGPGFNPHIRQWFLCFIFCFVVVVYLLFCKKNPHYLSQKFAIPFTMLIYLVYLTYCKICDRL